jgi:hypothetical protein
LFSAQENQNRTSCAVHDALEVGAGGHLECYFLRVRDMTG